MINTLYTMDAIDNRIAEITAEIERWTPFANDNGPNTASTVDQAQSAIDVLEDELQELEDFDRVVTLAGTDESAIDAALDYAAGDLDRAAELIGNGVQEYASVREYGEERFDGIYSKRSEFYQFVSYIDFEAFGTDALMDVEYHEHNGRIYVFNT